MERVSVIFPIFLIFVLYIFVLNKKLVLAMKDTVENKQYELRSTVRVNEQ